MFHAEPINAASVAFEAAVVGWAAVGVYALCVIAAAVVVGVLLSRMEGVSHA